MKASVFGANFAMIMKTGAKFRSSTFHICFIEIYKCKFFMARCLDWISTVKTTNISPLIKLANPDHNPKP